MDAEDGERESSATGRKLNWCCCMVTSVRILEFGGGEGRGADGGSDGAVEGRGTGGLYMDRE